MTDPPATPSRAMRFRPQARLSDFSRCVILAQEDVPGFANADDALHFAMILGYQNQTGLQGDLLEIGSYFGKSAMVIAYFKRPSEKLFVCDAFQHETQDKYADKPTVADLLGAIRRSTSQFPEEDLEVHNCLSCDLVIPEGRRFRFAHIDGGHSKEEALYDLNLVADRMVIGGTIAVDDYSHPKWPGVEQAVDAFLAARPDYSIFADMNRWPALGRKVYLLRKPASFKPDAAPEQAIDLEAHLRQVKALRFYQKIDLPDGTTTNGHADHRRDPQLLGISGDFIRGRRVLDVAANDGFWSFWAEKQGAKQVVAIDVEKYENYDWGIRGVPREFQGKPAKNENFDHLRVLFGSSVQRQHLSVYELDPQQHGQFDVTFCYGLIYHLRHPLLAIDRMRAVTREICIIKTHSLLHDAQLPSNVFFMDDVLANAVTNWSGPTEACMVHWMKDAGFDHVFVERRQSPSGGRNMFAKLYVGCVGDQHSALFRNNDLFSYCDEGYFERSRKRVLDVLSPAP